LPPWTSTRATPESVGLETSVIVSTGHSRPAGQANTLLGANSMAHDDAKRPRSVNGAASVAGGDRISTEMAAPGDKV
jgi:hypothetical protein